MHSRDRILIGSHVRSDLDRPDDVELDPVDERVVIDRSGVRSAVMPRS